MGGIGLLAACRAERPRHVILVVVDTLRADHLAAYGYGRPTSPTVDALARSSVLFEDARSQSSCTFPSVNSLLTSRAPEIFLGQPHQAMGIPAGVPSLAEALAGRGYRTVAVSASPIVRRTPSRFNPSGGFGRGFQVFDESCTWQPAACVNARALPYLRQPAGPLFLYLHYIDPHGPYSPPPGWRRRFAAGSPDPAKDWVGRGDPNPIARFLYAGGPDPGATPADVRHLVDLYDEEIAYLDARLGELLAALDRSGLAGDTLLVVASDHGEEFLEHGHVKHCRTVFDSSIHTPLLFRIPGVAAGRRRARAQNLDIAPTVLDYLGIDAAKLGFEGRSLRPAIERGSGDSGGRAGSAYQFSGQGSLRAAVDGRYKLIEDLATGRVQLYDLVADPGETRDALPAVAAADRRGLGLLRDALRAHLAAAERAGKGAHASTQAEKRLRSLGYLE
jgi:arylsulfatase A-like enzyme